MGKMMTKQFKAVLSTVLLFQCMLTADAALLSRLGGQAVYDTDLKVTWLADANAAAGSIYASSGRMTWANVNAWADIPTGACQEPWTEPDGVSGLIVRAAN